MTFLTITHSLSQWTAQIFNIQDLHKANLTSLFVRCANIWQFRNALFSASLFWPMDSFSDVTMHSVVSVWTSLRDMIRIPRSVTLLRTLYILVSYAIALLIVTFVSALQQVKWIYEFGSTLLSRFADLDHWCLFMAIREYCYQPKKNKVICIWGFLV